MNWNKYIKNNFKRLNIDPDCKAPDLSENDIAAYVNF